MTTPFFPISPTVPELIQIGAVLKDRINNDSAALAKINLKLESVAVFPDGKSTAHMAGGGYAVTVQRKQSMKWDQTALERVLTDMGNAAFFKMFKWEFELASSKALNGFLEFGDSEQTKAVRSAMIVAPASPYVTYKQLGEEEFA